MTFKKNNSIYVYSSLMLLITLAMCKIEEIPVGTITTSVEGNGRVSPNYVEFKKGESVTLTAMPDKNWIFLAWTGGILSRENPLTVYPVTDKLITATFITDEDKDGVLDNIDRCPNTNSGAFVDSDGCEIPIYLAENGVTIKATEVAVIGVTYMVNNVGYKVVDKDELQFRIHNGLDINHVVTTFVTDMSNLFYTVLFFNKNIDISTWDVSSVTNMSNMFANSSYFNQNLTYWDVSSVKDMSFMFDSSSNFNQKGNFTLWDVSSVIDMHYMFYNITTLEVVQPNISAWNVSNVQNMTGMFWSTSSFNEDISSWDVKNVTKMRYMFARAHKFNQDLSKWGVDNVNDCDYFDLNTPAWALPKPDFPVGC